MEMTRQATQFGELIRCWRNKRNLSQLALANAMDTTPRHVSFLETGRSKPTQSMILRLADALDVPFRERNILFQAAGFAAQYKIRDLQNPDVGVMSNAIQLILKNHDPFPGFVLDRYWNLLQANEAGECMLQRIVPGFSIEGNSTNMLMAMFSGSGLQHQIDNWEDVAKQMIQRIRRESFDDDESYALIKALRKVSDLPDEYWDIDLDNTISPVIPMKINVMPGLTLSMLSTVTTFGTPVDVLAQELRIELVLPADEITEQAMRSRVLQGGT